MESFRNFQEAAGPAWWGWGAGGAKRQWEYSKTRLEKWGLRGTHAGWLQEVIGSQDLNSEQDLARRGDGGAGSKERPVYTAVKTVRGN